MDAKIAPVAQAYRDDIARLCDVVVQSGADCLPTTS